MHHLTTVLLFALPHILLCCDCFYINTICVPHTVVISLKLELSLIHWIKLSVNFTYFSVYSIFSYELANLKHGVKEIITKLLSNPVTKNMSKTQ